MGDGDLGMNLGEAGDVDVDEESVFARISLPRGVFAKSARPRETRSGVEGGSNLRESSVGYPPHRRLILVHLVHCYRISISKSRFIW